MSEVNLSNGIAYRNVNSYLKGLDVPSQQLVDILAAQLVRQVRRHPEVTLNQG